MVYQSMHNKKSVLPPDFARQKTFQRRAVRLMNMARHFQVSAQNWLEATVDANFCR
jgi:hypothetical protein